jgi:hypothetical protein
MLFRLVDFVGYGIAVRGLDSVRNIGCESGKYLSFDSKSRNR